jgi:PAS domain S-box-containing protein
MEKRYLKKNGDTVWTRHSVSAARTVNGKVETFIVIAEDISERKRMEARFRRLVDSNVQAVLFWNEQGEVIGGNDAFLGIVGYTREDLEAGRIKWREMTPPEYIYLDQRAGEELAATGISQLYEKEWVRKDGSRVPVLIGNARFEDNSNEGVSFALDLTERKKVEEQLRLSQKMESIGTLAGGIAHDFNNFLTIIQMQTHLFKSSGSLTPDQLKYIDIIDTTAQHSSALTRQLLLFSRKQTTQLRDLDLSKSINEMGNIIRRTIGEDIELQLKLSSLPLFIHGDAGMVDQVLMNLVVNSRDAMPKGGKLIIETSSVDFDEKTSKQVPKARAGSFVCLSVTDSGCGIPKENISKIFEPFFTTKEVGKGTGLGLATLFGIIQQLGGWVNVYSEVGQGTTFRVYLPRLATYSHQTSNPTQNASKLGGNETLLYVEDDEFLRNAVCEILSQLGYRVLAAKDSAEALEIWKKHTAEIRLLLTDLVMPGKISGKELGDHLLKENPKLKVIFSSGYSVEIAGKDFNLEEGANFLTKPFEAHKLARTVRDCLDKRL